MKGREDEEMKDREAEDKLFELIETLKLETAYNDIQQLKRLDLGVKNDKDETLLGMLLRLMVEKKGYNSHIQQSLFEKLLDLSEPHHLSQTDKSAKSAFDYALELGDIDVIKAMVLKNNELKAKLIEYNLPEKAVEKGDYEQAYNYYEHLYQLLGAEIDMGKFKKLLDGKIATEGSKVGLQDKAFLLAYKLKTKQNISTLDMPRYSNVEENHFKNARLNSPDINLEMQKRRMENNQANYNALNIRISNAVVVYKELEGIESHHYNAIKALSSNESGNIKPEQAGTAYEASLLALVKSYESQYNAYTSKKKRIGLFTRHNGSPEGFANYLNKNQNGHHYSRLLGLILKNEIDSNEEKVKSLLNNDERFEKLREFVGCIEVNKKNQSRYGDLYTSLNQAAPDRAPGRKSS